MVGIYLFRKLSPVLRDVQLMFRTNEACSKYLFSVWHINNININVNVSVNMLKYKYKQLLLPDPS